MYGIIVDTMSATDIDKITLIINECRALVPHYIYMVLIDKNKRQTLGKLRTIDEDLNRLLLVLDGSNVNRTTRKTKIMEIQEIQKAIDHVCQ